MTTFLMPPIRLRILQCRQWYLPTNLLIPIFFFLRIATHCVIQYLVVLFYHSLVQILKIIRRKNPQWLLGAI